MQFFSFAIDTLQTLVVALGAGLGVWGVVNLLEGYGSDNPGSKSQGNACRGYVIYAMENCGFSPNEIRRVVAELYEVFDFRSLEEAQQHFEESPY